MAPAIFVLALLLPIALVESAAGPQCLTAALPNILDLGTCLGLSLDLCEATVEDIVVALVKVAECLVTALLNLDVETALAALLDIVELVLKLLGIDISELTSAINPLCAVSNVHGCRTVFSGSDTCRQAIVLSVPGDLNLDVCLGDSLILCDNGDPLNDNILVSLINALVCLLKTLLGSNPGSLLYGLACAVADLLESVAASVGIALKAVCLGLATSIRAGVRCG